jgi:two-component sensor histidine kinase
LRAADQRKDEFLATLAHELRNPLAPLRNCLHILRAREGDDAQMRKLHGMMERQVANMVRLVDDLMEVSRITRGEIELRRQRVTLREVLEGAVETSRPLIEQAGHHFHFDLTAEPLPLDADPMRLAQVFTNLLNNAAKYTPSGGEITLRATRDGGVAEILVRDNGIGLPQEMLTQVFDMFTQSEHGRAHSQGGLGIGLTLVRSLVEQHGGTVEARSDGVGEGSDFVVRLPLVASKVQEASSGDWPIVRQPAAMSIVIADDNHESADSMALFLQMRGHDVRTVYDGRACLDAVAERRPDVVLLDLGMRCSMASKPASASARCRAATTSRSWRRRLGPGFGPATQCAMRVRCAPGEAGGSGVVAGAAGRAALRRERGTGNWEHVKLLPVPCSPFPLCSRDLPGVSRPQPCSSPPPSRAPSCRAGTRR